MKYKQLISTQSFKRKELEQRQKLERINLVEKQQSALRSLASIHQEERSKLLAILDKERNVWRLSNSNQTLKRQGKCKEIYTDLQPLPPIPSHRQVDQERISSKPYPMPEERTPISENERCSKNSNFTQEKRVLQQADKLIKRKLIKNNDSNNGSFSILSSLSSSQPGENKTKTKKRSPLADLSSNIQDICSQYSDQNSTSTTLRSNSPNSLLNFETCPNISSSNVTQQTMTQSRQIQQDQSNFELINLDFDTTLFTSIGLNETVNDQNQINEYDSSINVQLTTNESYESSISLHKIDSLFIDSIESTRLTSATECLPFLAENDYDNQNSNNNIKMINNNESVFLQQDHD